jgi:hypothetical protein
MYRQNDGDQEIDSPYLPTGRRAVGTWFLGFPIGHLLTSTRKNRSPGNDYLAFENSTRAMTSAQKHRSTIVGYPHVRVVALERPGSDLRNLTQP